MKQRIVQAKKRKGLTYLGLEIRRHDDVLIVSIFGEFDLCAVDNSRREIDQKMKVHGTKHILFDLGGVVFIDSSGLGVILGRYRRVTEQGGEVAIAGVAPQLFRILEIAGIPRLIQIYPDAAQALQALVSRGGNR